MPLVLVFIVSQWNWFSATKQNKIHKKINFSCLSYGYSYQFSTLKANNIVNYSLSYHLTDDIVTSIKGRLALCKYFNRKTLSVLLCLIFLHLILYRSCGYYFDAFLLICWNFFPSQLWDITIFSKGIKGMTVLDYCNSFQFVCMLMATEAVCCSVQSDSFHAEYSISVYKDSNPKP